MKQVYKIDADGFYVEPVLISPQIIPVEVIVSNPNDLSQEGAEEPVDNTTPSYKEVN